MAITPTEIQMKIGELQAQLLSDHPQMPTLLREIHTTLKADPETVTLLTDAEVGTIVAALQKFTGNHITAAATKTKAAGSRAALKSITADDL